MYTKLGLQCRDQIINVYNIIGSIGRLYLTSMAKLQQADFIQTLLRITSIHAAIECLIYKQHPLTISTFIKQLYAIAQSLMYIPQLCVTFLICSYGDASLSCHSNKRYNRLSLSTHDTHANDLHFSSTIPTSFVIFGVIDNDFMLIAQLQ